MLNNGPVPVLLALGLAAVSVVSASAAEETEGRAPTRRALLIGIDDYLDNSTFDDLKGAVNDVTLMRTVLMRNYGFEDQNITLLTNQQATREQILKRLRAIAAEAGPRDAVYIHFSGHGSQTPDVNGDEGPDEKGSYCDVFEVCCCDETIVPYDFGSDGAPQILDDEIGLILDQMKASSVLVVLDSCYSGTGTRQVNGFRTRSAPPDSRVELYASLQEQVAESLRGAPPHPQRYVLMTGATSAQGALDGPVARDDESGTVLYHGVWSYSLAHALVQTKAAQGVDPTVLEVYGAATRIFGNYVEGTSNAGTRPQLESAFGGADKAIFGTSIGIGPTARLPWIEVHPESAGRVTLIDAMTLGALPRSRWAIYGPSEIEFTPGAALAIATVTGVRDNSSVEATVMPPDVHIPKGSRAIAHDQAPGSGEITVLLDQVDETVGIALRAAVRRISSFVSFVDNGDFARLVVDVRANECSVFRPNGITPISSFAFDPENPAGAARRLVELASRTRIVDDLVALENRSSRLDVIVRVLPEDQEHRPQTIATAGDGKMPAYRMRAGRNVDGTWVFDKTQQRTRGNSLLLEVETSETAYITVVFVDSQGDFFVMFPNTNTEKVGYYPKGLVKANQAIRLPDSVAADNRARFWVDMKPPAGEDTVVVFAATRLQGAELIRGHLKAAQLAAMDSDDTRTRGRPGWQSPLQELRDTLAMEATTRGGALILGDEETSEEDDSTTSLSKVQRLDWTSTSTHFFVIEQ